MRIPIRILIDEYQSHLYRIAFNICKNREDAEDIVQDTFVQYHISNKEYDDESHIRAWLMRVTINKSRNTLRSFWRKHRQSLESYMEELNFPDSQSEELFEAVMKLPEKQRTVIHLFYYEDYSIKEIAEILHVSESNIKVRLNRGRAALRKIIKEDWNYDES